MLWSNALKAVLVILVILVLVMILMVVGWIKFGNDGGNPTLEVDTQEIREDTGRAYGVPRCPLSSQRLCRTLGKGFFCGA